MHSIVPKDMKALTKDNYRILIYTKSGLKMIRQIPDLEKLEKWVTSKSIPESLSFPHCHKTGSILVLIYILTTF